MARRPTGGGRQRLFTQQQELAIVNLVRATNTCRWASIQQHKSSKHYNYQTDLGKAQHDHEATVQGPI